MACGCQGSKSPDPATWSRGQKDRGAQPQPGRQAPVPPAPPARRSGSGERRTYALVTADRGVMTFGSRLEAEAAKVRNQGRGEVREIARQ